MRHFKFIHNKIMCISLFKYFHKTTTAGTTEKRFAIYICIPINALISSAS